MSRELTGLISLDALFRRVLRHRDFAPKRKRVLTDKVRIGFMRADVEFFCDVCGREAEWFGLMGQVLSGEHEGLRVCAWCMQECDIDAKLTERAMLLEARAQRLRSLVGRLEVPTSEEYEATRAALRRRDEQMAAERDALWHERNLRQREAGKVIKLPRRAGRARFRDDDLPL